MASNSSSEYKVIADKIVSPDEDIIVKVRGAMYKDSIEEPNRYATINDLEDVSGVSATSENTPDTVVKRDGSGNFAAGTLSLNGVNVQDAGSIYEDGGLIVQAASGYGVLVEGDQDVRIESNNGNIILDADGAAYIGDASSQNNRIATMADVGNGGGGGDLVIPFTMKDTNGDDLLSFEKGGTGVTRINAVQDDLALRSARDIILYPGDDGPGNVYINWGDATYTPDATNKVATIADIQAANTGDITFVDNTISSETGDDIVIQNKNNEDVVKARITLDQGNEQVLIEAIDEDNNWFNDTQWSTAVWSGTTINITNTPDITNFFNTLPGNVTRISVNNGSTVVYQGASFGDGAISINVSAAPSEDPLTVTEIRFYYSIISKIDIDYDNGSFDIEAKNMDLNISSDDDVYITAGGDDLFLRANDDIRFTSNYQNGGTENFWRMDSEGQFHFPGAGYIENPADSSSDLSGYDTIKIVPDSNLLVDNNQTADQYIVIDPTDPTHIHVRAGGAIDESTATLILGGEKNSVIVSDAIRGVAVTTRYPRIQNIYGNSNEASNTEFMVASGADIQVGYTVTPVAGGDSFTVTAVTENYPYEGLTTVVADGLSFVSGEAYTFVFESPFTNLWQFTSDGVLSGPAMGGVKVPALANQADGDDLLIYATGADINIQANDGVASINAQNVNLTSNNNTTINTLGGDRTWNFTDGGVLYGPAEDGQLEVAGIRGENGHPTVFIGPESVVLDGNNGEFLNDPNVPGNQIATRSDLSANSGTAFQSVRWTPAFTATGLAFSGSGATHPTYNSYYVKQGQLVSFWIEVDMATVTNFGTGQYKVELPFAPLTGTMNHFSGWVNVDETANPDLAGHIIVNADHLANTSVLDLHYIKQSGGANSPVMEAMLKQNTPVVMTTATHIYVNGTYIAAAV